MMVQKDEVSLAQGARKSKTFYMKGATSASKVAKLYKKHCQILR